MQNRDYILAKPRTPEVCRNHKTNWITWSDLANKPSKMFQMDNHEVKRVKFIYICDAY
jgi:cAMP phosphodiesterase